MFRIASYDRVRLESPGSAIRAIRSQSHSRECPMPGLAYKTTPNEKENPKKHGPNMEESQSARIERLGRQRPDIFKNIFTEITFVFCITMSQIVTEYMISGFVVILPTLIKELDIPQASSIWPATAFSLVIASTLLVFGRLGDMFGGYPVYLFGLSWLLLWSVIAGFSINPLMLDFCRALQGLGAAAYLPTGLMLLGGVYRPGPRKNLVFSLYGACAVVGFFVGIFFSGVVGQFIHWGWYFWIGAALIAVTLMTSVFAVPNDMSEKRKNNVSMDYLGAITIVSGLILTVFAITESSHAPSGWRTPYIPVTLIVGLFILLLAAYIEGWIAETPILPAEIFKHRSMAPLIISMLFLYGTLGIFLLYGTQYFEDIMGASPLQVVAWYVPMVVGGLALSTAGGFVLHLVPPKPLLIVSGCGAVGESLLLALIPEGGNYWAWILPAMVLATIAIDIAYNMTTIFMTTQLPSRQQGLAGGLVNSVLQLGLALCLGFTDIVQTETQNAGAGLRTSYKNTFWFGVASGGVALCMNAFFVHIPKAKSDLTVDEKQELDEEVRREARARLDRSVSSTSTAC